MPCRQSAFGPSEELDKTISGADRVNGRTRLAGPARAVHLARRYAGDAYFRPLSAPNRAVAIPHGRWRTGEAFAGWNYPCGRFSVSGRQKPECEKEEV